MMNDGNYISPSAPTWMKTARIIHGMGGDRQKRLEYVVGEIIKILCEDGCSDAFIQREVAFIFRCYAAIELESLQNPQSIN